METLYLDTHIVVWLFTGDIKKISPKALNLIEHNELLISPMVILELEFLYEIKRLKYQHHDIISSLSQSIDLKVCPLSFEKIATKATKLNWTRDPFDRIIVSNAQLNQSSKLITRDKKILQHYENAFF